MNIITSIKRVLVSSVCCDSTVGVSAAVSRVILHILKVLILILYVCVTLWMLCLLMFVHINLSFAEVSVSLLVKLKIQST